VAHQAMLPGLFKALGIAGMRGLRLDETTCVVQCSLGSARARFHGPVLDGMLLIILPGTRFKARLRTAFNLAMQCGICR